MITDRVVITGSAYTAMFFLGVSITVIGAAARNIGISAAEIGLLVSAQNAGFVIGVLVAGSLADTRPKPRILFAGSLLLAASYLLFYARAELAVNLAVMLVMGLGIGCYEATTDALLLEIHARNESLHINVNHFFVTFGSLIVTAYLIQLQMSWRRSMVQSAAGALALALLFALTRVGVRPHAASSLRERLGSFVGERTFLLAFVLTIVTLGAGQLSQSVMTTYLMELRGFDQVTSKVALVVLLAGVGAGRLAVGFLTRRGRLYPTLIASCALSAVTSLLFYSADLGRLAYAAVFVQGVTQSAQLPLLITITGLLHRDVSGTAMGVLKLAIPLGGIILPLLFSALTEVLPLSSAVGIFPLAFAAASAAAWAGRGRLRTEATR